MTLEQQLLLIDNPLLQTVSLLALIWYAWQRSIKHKAEADKAVGEADLVHNKLDIAMATNLDVLANAQQTVVTQLMSSIEHLTNQLEVQQKDLEDYSTRLEVCEKARKEYWEILRVNNLL